MMRQRASIFETPSKNSFFQDFWQISEGRKMLISQKENEAKIFQQTFFFLFFLKTIKKNKYYFQSSPINYYLLWFNKC